MDTHQSHEAPSPGLSQAPALLAGIGIGAALMYLLDPQRGAQRRALVRDQAASALRTGQREARDVAQDVRNRAVGAAAELRGRFAHEPVTDDQLVARVRAELGHHVERARVIEVAAENGTVTLRGEVPPEELDEVLSTVRRVRGVESVNSQLSTSSAPGTAATL